MAGNVSEELARLAALRDQGVLTQEEFEAQKAATLRGDVSPSPTTSQASPEKKSAAKKGCLLLVLIIVVLIFVGMILGGKGGSGGDNASTDAAAVAEVPTEVTADDLFRAYQANEAAAQQNYGDRPLLVSGKVASIDLDLTNNPVVQLQTSNEFMNASAHLTDAAKPKASTLSKGQQVRLLCKSVSEVISMPQLQDCDIQ